MKKEYFFAVLFLIEANNFLYGLPMERASEKKRTKYIPKTGLTTEAYNRREDYLEGEEEGPSNDLSGEQASRENEKIPQDEDRLLFSSEQTKQNCNMEIKRTVRFSEVEHKPEVEQKSSDSSQVSLDSEGDFFGIKVEENELQHCRKKPKPNDTLWKSLVKHFFPHKIIPIDKELLEAEQKKISATEKNLEIPVQSLQKKNDKQIGRYHRNFLTILQTIETDIDDITDQDPEASAKKADIYTKVYPELKRKLQELAAFIQQNQNDLVALHDKREVNLLNKATNLLARNTQKFITVAIQTTDFKSIRPTKAMESYAVKYHNISIPTRIVEFGRIDPEDADFQYLIERATKTDRDLFNFLRPFFLPKSNADLSLSKYLSDQQKNLASNATHLNHCKLNLIAEKKAYLSNFPNSDSTALLAQLESQEKEISEKLAVFQGNEEQGISPVTDVAEALKNCTVDLLKKTREAFDIAEELKTLLATRKPTMIFQQPVTEKRPFHPTVMTKLASEEQKFLEKTMQEALSNITEHFFRQKHETEYLKLSLDQQKQSQKEALQQLNQLKEEQAESNKTKQSTSWWKLPSFSKTIHPLSKDYDHLIDSAEKKYSKVTQEMEKILKEMELNQDGNRIDNLSRYLVEKKLTILNQLQESYPEKPYLAEAFLELYEKKCYELQNKVAEELFYFSGIQPEQFLE